MPAIDSERGAPFDFSGKTALVTGGSRGIGSVLSRALARCGADVVVNYREDRQSAEETVGRIRSEGGKARAFPANLVNPEEIRSLFDSLPHRLDFFIHSAALGSFKRLLDVRANQWELSLSVNARALLLCAQQALPRMREQGGAIVGISSLGSSRVIPEYGAIGVSKAAMESLVRGLAVEMAADRIRVNAVAAGVIDGETIRKHPQASELLERSRAWTPTGKLLTAEKLSDVVLFLLSPLAEGIIGQTIVVDGGMSLRL
jgi:enoyl-[acyl-carrier protein] reductase III